MAFNNTRSADFVRLSKAIAWIDGLQLIPNDSGTISFTGGDGELRLPEGFLPRSDQELRGAVRVTVIPNTAGPLTNLPVSVTKQDDGVIEDFLITLTNTNVNLNTQLFEVYVELIGDADGTNSDSGVVVNVNVNRC